MTRLLRRSRRDRSRGQTLVEFALILPVFLTLTLGVVDGARIFTAYIAVTNASREGALYASQGSNYSYWCSTTTTVACPTGWVAANQHTDPDNIAFRVQQEVQALTQANVILSAPTCVNSAGTSVSCGASAAKVTIKVDYSMTLFVPFVSALMGSPVRMSASTTAVLQ
jgi:Flp pilus assembly protein TadG